MSRCSTAEYVKDYDCLIEGVEFIFKIEQKIAEQKSIEPLRKHYEQHPEDKLCHIYRPGTRQMVHCRRSGIDAIWRMANRLVEEARNGFDLSSKRISEIISERILQVAFDGITNDDELVKILKSYVTASESEHIEALYRFPCILLHYSPADSDLELPPPKQFGLGPVRFQQFKVFAREFEDDVRNGLKSADEKALEMFSKTGEKYGWMASVAIPRCASDVSRRRAEDVIGAAINLLKVFVGLRHAKSMRLPHTAPSRNRETCVLIDVDNTVKWMWQGRSLEGALVAGDPLGAIPPYTRGFASNLLNQSLTGKRDEVTTRLLDALRWFGDASFEESGGVQIVKWIAALERLTATERLFKGMTHTFCKRVALLASGLGAGKVERAYRAAYRAYDLRSDVMHGARSQNDHELAVNAGFVHDLTRETIIGALAAHHFLTAQLGDGKVETLARMYDQTATPHTALFETLRQEFRKLVRHTPPRNATISRP